MPIETIEFNGVEYPAFQAKGNAARWVIPYAKEYCKGHGIDIGCSRPEWAFPLAMWTVDPAINGYDAMNFPYRDLDYIFSSHCLEHVKENWYNVLDYWLTKIKVGGIIFLYLPHKSQEYWLPKNNRKHVHSFDSSEIYDYLRSLGHKVIKSGVDLNNSFVVVCEKVDTENDLLNHSFSCAKALADFQEESNVFLHSHNPNEVEPMDNKTMVAYVLDENFNGRLYNSK